MAGFAGIVLISMSGCGGATEAAGPVDTIVELGAQNYQSVAPVTAAPTTVPSTAPTAGQTTTEETIYIVKPNDSLPLIAARYKLDISTLQKYNGFSSPNPTIHPGDEIKIPIGATVPGTDTSSDTGTDSTDSTDGASDTTNAPGTGCTYTVEAGDNPTKIAKKTGVTIEAFTEANQASGVLNSLLVGSKVIIPAPGTCP